MSDIIAHTDISTRTSRSNVKANKLDVNDTQYDGTCKGSSSEDLQKDDESSSPPQGPCYNLACDMGTTCI